MLIESVETGTTVVANILIIENSRELVNISYVNVHKLQPIRWIILFVC